MDQRSWSDQIDRGYSLIWIMYISSLGLTRQHLPSFVCFHIIGPLGLLQWMDPHADECEDPSKKSNTHID